MYIKVTGPYHSYIVGNKSTYLELYKAIQEIYEFLKERENHPEVLLDKDRSVGPTLQMVHPELHGDIFQPLFPEQKDLLLDTLKRLSRAFVKTCDLQLVDFLPGGKYSTAPAETELERTSFSRLDNLSCERHLGSLDASQRRRPNATFHFHSTIEMVKQNREDIVKWYKSKTKHEKKLLWSDARKRGFALRLKHKSGQEAEEQKKTRDSG